MSTLTEKYIVQTTSANRDFEESRTFFKKYTHALSVPFLLGFYVTTVAERWWMQYLTVPWPDRYTFIDDFKIFKKMPNGLIIEGLCWR